MQRVDFDEYVSLGYNCEVAFQFRRTQGYDNPHFFNWNITTPKIALDLITARFDGIMQDRYEDKNGLSVDVGWGYHYHGLPTLEEDLSKGLHLAQKFFRPSRRAYFIELYEDVSRELLIALGRQLHQISPDFTVVIVRRTGEAQGFRLPRIVEREVAFFAPLDNAEAADLDGWDAIFEEFPLAEAV